MNFNRKRKLQKDVAKGIKGGRLHKLAKNLLVGTVAVGMLGSSTVFSSNIVAAATTKSAQKAAKADKTDESSKLSNELADVLSQMHEGVKQVYQGTSNLQGKLTSEQYQQVKPKIDDILAKVQDLPEQWDTFDVIMHLEDITDIYNDAVAISNTFKGTGVKTELVNILHGAETIDQSLGSKQITELKDIYTAIEGLHGSDAENAAGDLAQKFHPSIAEMYHGLNDLKRDLTSTEYQTVKDNIKNILAKLKKLEDIGNDPSKLLNENVLGIYNDAVELADKLEGTGVKTDLVAILHGAEDLNAKIGNTEIGELKTVYEALEALTSDSDATKQKIGKLAQKLRPGMTDVYHGLAQLRKDLPADHAIKDQIKGILADIKDLPKIDNWDDISDNDKAAIKDIYNKTLTVTTTLAGTGVKTDLETVMSGLDKMNQVITTEEAEDLKDIYHALEKPVTDNPSDNNTGSDTSSAPSQTPQAPANTEKPTDNNTGEAAPAETTKTLKHNAYVYDKNGKRANKKVLKKSTDVKVTGTKTIKGKKYYVIADGQYVKAANFTGTETKLRHNAYVYNKNGKRANKKVLKKGKKIKTFSTKTIKGKKFASIGKGHYVKVANLK
ncbi:SLAP domain-containing protein [Lactobacillus sp. ESL0681]|uniref:SLAP domain-containing protein n=1 Tax=Lactobacillus sp. ESL0681 TaxID=2983211 RepID=UPI0023F96BFD|nr:SLAP domain-containing protein [Lactobacillus sp. ESL0681]WEV39960.1 SLAP domain-containing protein [Lactobacillus sp. ESL0681]